MLDPGPTDEQQALADAIRRLGVAVAGEQADARRPVASDLATPDRIVFPWASWRRLAALGVLGIGSTEGGGAMGVLAAMEALGQTLFPGPLVATFFALQVIEPTTAAGLVSGEHLVSAASGPYFPWGNDATWLVTIDGDVLSLSRRTAAGPQHTSLAREPWTQPDYELVHRHPVPAQAVVHGDLALAGYVAGAAGACLLQTAEYARERRQFGRSIGAFQAVSHALARADAALSSALGLARRCAWEWDHGGRTADRPALARRAAVTASVDAVLHCHQVFGAMGFSEETGLWRRSTKIRELSRSWPSGNSALAAVNEGRRFAAEGRMWRDPMS